MTVATIEVALPPALERNVPSVSIGARAVRTTLDDLEKER
jgi:hypothetical protein